jgi:hypothetical protein
MMRSIRKPSKGLFELARDPPHMALTTVTEGSEPVEAGKVPSGFSFQLDHESSRKVGTEWFYDLVNVEILAGFTATIEV